MEPLLFPFTTEVLVLLFASLTPDGDVDGEVALAVGVLGLAGVPEQKKLLIREHNVLKVL